MDRSNGNMHATTTTSTSKSATPCRDRLRRAERALERAQRAGHHPMLVEIAEVAVLEAREDYAASDEPRRWYARDEHCDDGPYVGATVEDVRGRIEASWAEAYAECDASFRLCLHIWCPDTGEVDSIQMDIDPEEPACAYGHSHYWSFPHEIVGGCKSNPGSFAGEGGGVREESVCRHCGVRRTIETRADDGYGGTMVREEFSPADDDTRAWVAEGAPE
jgi:hypothetical protein